MINYSGEITFTNQSDGYIVVADCTRLVFSGTRKECEKYTNNNPLRESGSSSLSIVAPGQTIRTLYSNGDSES